MIFQINSNDMTILYNASNLQYSQTVLWISENDFDNIILDSNICWITVLARAG